MTLAPDPTPPPPPTTVIDPLWLRCLIGLIGAALPTGCIVGAALTATEFQPSLSAYFHTPMRELFVATLCANAVAFLAYVGHDDPHGRWWSDWTATRIAAVTAALIAIVPIPGPGQDSFVEIALGHPGAQTAIHLGAAFLHFLVLALISLTLFTRGNTAVREKRASNRVHRACGWIILGCLALMGADLATGVLDRFTAWHPFFWIEAVATWAFAASWLVKGDSLRPLVALLMRGER